MAMLARLAHLADLTAEAYTHLFHWCVMTPNESVLRRG